jgi:hypothetical protein
VQQFVFGARRNRRHLGDCHWGRLGKRRQERSANRGASRRLRLAGLATIARMTVAVPGGRHFSRHRHFDGHIACLSDRQAQPRSHEDRKQNRKCLSNQRKRHGPPDHDDKPVKKQGAGSPKSSASRANVWESSRKTGRRRCEPPRFASVSPRDRRAIIRAAASKNPAWVIWPETAHNAEPNRDGSRASDWCAATPARTPSAEARVALCIGRAASPAA